LPPAEVPYDFDKTNAAIEHHAALPLCCPLTRGPPSIS
jgi:hypothetical protein